MVALSPHGNSSMYTFKFRNFSEGKSAYMYTCASQPLKLLLTYPTGRSGPRSLRLYGFICSTVQRKRKIPSEGSMASIATTTTWHTVYRKRIVCRDCVYGRGGQNIYTWNYLLWVTVYVHVNLTINKGLLFQRVAIEQWSYWPSPGSTGNSPCPKGRPIPLHRISKVCP